MKKSKKSVKKQSSCDWSHLALVVLRIALGWLFLYAGISKLITPDWSAAGFLAGAKTFHGFYAWFASQQNIVWVDFLNTWGQIAIGTGLITGTLTRLAAWFGMLMMALYYFPRLEFPYLEHAFLVDEHVIYFLALGLLASYRAGSYAGLDKYLGAKCKSFWI